MHSVVKTTRGNRHGNYAKRKKQKNVIGNNFFAKRVGPERFTFKRRDRCQDVGANVGRLNNA